MIEKLIESSRNIYSKRERGNSIFDEEGDLKRVPSIVGGILVVIAIFVLGGMEMSGLWN